MSRFYGMGPEGLALCGMDDAGEMSAWYVFSAIGLYPYSPADEDYLVSVPLFDKSDIELNGKTLTILKPNAGRNIADVSYDDHQVDGYFVPHHELIKGKKLIIATK